MTAGDGMITVQPNDLKFIFELEKQSFCDLKVVNNTEHHVAFKVKTTSPKKYFVRPNTGVVQPWDSTMIRVTLQAQKEYPPDMQCKDKFLLQSTVVPANTDVDDLAPDTFTKGSGKVIDECKLKVIYASPNSASDDEGMRSSIQSPESKPDLQRDTAPMFVNNVLTDCIPFALQRLKDERDAAVRQTAQLQQELDMLRRRRRKGGSGFSFSFAIVVALIGIMGGFLLNLSLSSPETLPTPTPPTDGEGMNLQ